MKGSFVQLFAGIPPSRSASARLQMQHLGHGRPAHATHRGDVSPTAPCVGLDGEEKHCRDLLNQQASLLPKQYALN